jgi:hypothetical protein
MREKKIRGIRRKKRDLLDRIVLNTDEFPANFYNGHWHMPLPAAKDFISSSKTPRRVKKVCIEMLIRRVEHLISIKPISKETLRVVAAIDLPALWNSQIIVFNCETNFNSFFERNNDVQKWIPLSLEWEFEREWQLNIPANLRVKGYKEVIKDEDGEYHREIWFVGEL